MFGICCGIDIGHSARGDEQHYIDTMSLTQPGNAQDHGIDADARCEARRIQREGEHNKACRTDGQLAPREVAARVVVKGMQRHARANEWRGGRQEASCIADMAGLRW
ncbi:MAG: hypothetical protein RR983_07625 [Massilia sp.]